MTEPRMVPLFDPRSRALTAALADIGDAFTAVGFKVQKRKEDEATLRVYVDSDRRPLLNPRLYKGYVGERERIPQPVLVVDVWDNPGGSVTRRMGRFRSDSGLQFVKAGHPSQGMWLVGSLLAPVEFHRNGELEETSYRSLVGVLSRLARALRPTVQAPLTISALTDPGAVEKAVERYDQLGRTAFLREYGFGAAKSYFLLHNGKHYDAKAIAGAAIRIQHRQALEWTAFGGGMPIQRRLGRLGFRVLASQITELTTTLSEEVDAAYPEGGAISVRVNRYERDVRAKRACIEAKGFVCTVCGFDFGKEYGAEFSGFIHVHHLRPLSLRGGRRQTHPVRDLAPVCPNCHAAIHYGRKLRTPEQIKAMMRRANPDH